MNLRWTVHTSPKRLLWRVNRIWSMFSSEMKDERLAVWVFVRHLYSTVQTYLWGYLYKIRSSVTIRNHHCVLDFLMVTNSIPVSFSQHSFFWRDSWFLCEILYASDGAWFSITLYGPDCCAAHKGRRGQRCIPRLSIGTQYIIPKHDKVEIDSSESLAVN